MDSSKPDVTSPDPPWPHITVVPVTEDFTFVAVGVELSPGEDDPGEPHVWPIEPSAP